MWQGIPSRRLTSRVEASDGVAVYCQCNGRADVVRVLNVGMGGLFIETLQPQPVGTKAVLDFLVQEGQIRAEAVVRHAKPRAGLGLKFVAMKEADRPHLAALLTRLRSAPVHAPRSAAAIEASDRCNVLNTATLRRA